MRPARCNEIYLLGDIDVVGQRGTDEESILRTEKTYKKDWEVIRMKYAGFDMIMKDVVALFK